MRVIVSKGEQTLLTFLREGEEGERDKAFEAVVRQFVKEGAKPETYSRLEVPWETYTLYKKLV
ncbi:MAG: hypothetical protein LC687_04040 [Actinobacteria bacterium]|nr:hypothetical protein [Actinomycetota bacterium]MCA1807008.1 hypothetical protein [Actinomycetota bacterium]